MENSFLPWTDEQWEKWIYSFASDVMSLPTEEKSAPDLPKLVPEEWGS